MPSKVGVVEDDTIARVIQQFYDLGVCPDWWKLEPMLTDNAWRQSIEAIVRNDANTRGIVILGLVETEEKLEAIFKVAARYPLVKGFAVGRTISSDRAKSWMLGGITY